MAPATQDVHPAYQQLAAFIFGGASALPESGRRSSLPESWKAITLTEEIVVNGNQFIPANRTIYIETPAN